MIVANRKGREGDKTEGSQHEEKDSFLVKFLQKIPGGGARSVAPQLCTPLNDDVYITFNISNLQKVFLKYLSCPRK